MRQVDRSAIVPFTAEAMFDLVADVGSYPEFLPGCTAARIDSRHGDQVLASIALAQGPLRFEFQTCNELARPARIGMSLRSGPFSELEGAWAFAPLGDAGCKITLTLRFGFENRVSDLLMGPPFEALCNRLIDAFVQRARAPHA